MPMRDIHFIIVLGLSLGAIGMLGLTLIKSTQVQGALLFIGFALMIFSDIRLYFLHGGPRASIIIECLAIPFVLGGTWISIKRTPFYSKRRHA
jgi:hypothetical protein